MKKRVVVLEDDPKCRKQVVELIENVSKNVDIVVADNILEAYKIIWKQEVSLLITGIELGTTPIGDSEYPGERLIRQIRKYAKYQFLPIIIVTKLESFRMYMYQEMNCYGFFLKPLLEEEFKNAIRQALQHEGKAETEKVFAVRKHNVYHMIHVEDVMYVESYHRMLHIHFRDESILEVSQKPIRYIMNAADSENLVRCARGTLVNREHIIGYSTEMQSVLLIGGTLVKVGRTYVSKMKEVARQIQDYNKRLELINNKYRVKMNKL